MSAFRFKTDIFINIMIYYEEFSHSLNCLWINIQENEISKYVRKKELLKSDHLKTFELIWFVPSEFTNNIKLL